MRGTLVLAISLITSSAFSDDTQALLSKCDSAVGSTEFVYCLGRVSGMADMMGYNGFLIDKGEKSELHRQASTCTGRPIPTNGALLQVFKNWAHSHPEHWSDNDLTGVLTALREKWPCP
jgi:hypothetical protein